MTTSMQRIIDNLKSDNPSISIWANLDGLIIDIQSFLQQHIWSVSFNKGLDNCYFSKPSELANYLEQIMFNLMSISDPDERNDGEESPTNPPSEDEQ